MNDTEIRLFDPRGRRSLAFGVPARLITTAAGQTAFLRGGSVVAYVIERGRRRAVYVFRTFGRTAATTPIDGVSQPVDLLFTCPTARTMRKALVAFRALSSRLAVDQVDRLSDLFWIRLSAAISVRGTLRVVPQVTSLLQREQSRI